MSFGSTQAQNAPKPIIHSITVIPMDDSNTKASLPLLDRARRNTQSVLEHQCKEGYCVSLSLIEAATLEAKKNYYFEANYV